MSVEYVTLRNLMHIGLGMGACIALTIAFDPGLHFLISAAGATFTAFATSQQMN
jgi:hypothetical protein